MDIKTSTLNAIGMDPMVLTTLTDESLGQIDIIFLDGAVKAGIISEAGAFISKDVKGIEKRAVFDELWEPDPVEVPQVLLDNFQRNVQAGENWLNIRLAVGNTKKKAQK